MKRLLALLSCVSLLLLQACHEDPYLTVSPENLSFTQEGGSQTVRVSANYAWTASVSGSGFSVSPASGEGDATLTVTASAASATDVLSGTLTVRSEGLSASVKLSQDAKNALLVGNVATIPYEGGTFSVEIQYNTEFSVEIEPSAKSWITFNGTKALSRGWLEFQFAANDGDERSGKVTVKDKAGKASPVTITFKQAKLVEVTAVTLDRTSAEIEIGETQTLKATVEPENATDKTVTWSSDNPEVATVENGRVTGVAVGTATITARAGEKSATCNVTVKLSAYETEKAALVAFYKANNGDHWKDNTNWCSDRPFAEWYGVTVSADRKHVTSLWFWRNGVIGYLPKEIGDLPMLQELVIACDDREAAAFTGYRPLPDEIGKLSELRTLALMAYPLSGKFPESLFNLTSLEYLYISSPLWMDSQPIPKAIANLKNLRTLGLNYAVSGSLIPEIGELRNLEDLRLNGNNLTGSIPDSYGNLVNLTSFSLDVNALSGPFPASMQRIDMYWRFWPNMLIGNRFTLADLQASQIPAPKSPVIETLSGGTLDLEDVFATNDYTVLYKAHPGDYPAENFRKLNALFQSNDRLGVITYYQNDGETDAERSVLDEAFRNALSQGAGDWPSFVYYLRKDYSATGGAPFYTIQHQYTFPDTNPSEAIVIGPEKTVIFTTALNTLSGNKFDDLIAFLEQELGTPLQHYASTDFKADGETKVLQKAGTGKGIDLVITGDAFSDRLIADGTFEQLARNAADNLFSAEPFKSLRDRFNIYLVNAVSTNEEYYNGCSTVFSGAFGYGAAVGGDNGKVLQYARKAVSDARMDNVLVLVLMNSGKAGGTCYLFNPEDASVYAGGAAVAWVPYNYKGIVFGKSGIASTLVHELGGHGLGKLADEYYYSSTGQIPDGTVQAVREQQKHGWYVNVDFTGNTANVRWNRFVNDSRYADEKIGAYVGAYGYSSGVWRPTDNSIMFSSGSPDTRFNAPSRAQLYTRIMKLSEGETWEFDYETFVTWDCAHRDNAKPAAAAPWRIESDGEENVHAKPVITGKTWKQLQEKR